jgi:hypothetical protein
VFTVLNTLSELMYVVAGGMVRLVLERSGVGAKSDGDDQRGSFSRLQFKSLQPDIFSSRAISSPPCMDSW